MEANMILAFMVPSNLLIWFMSACFFTALGCSQVGTFLVMRRMSLVGDAISHSVLPGIVVAFLVVGSLDSPWLLVGAGVSGMLATLLRARYCDPKIRSICKTDGLNFRIREILEGVAKITA